MKEEKKDWAIITIKVNNHIKKELEKLKVIPREPFYDVIQRLIATKNIKKKKNKIILKLSNFISIRNSFINTDTANNKKN